MDPNNNNRLYLNFGNGNDRLTASDRAAYPTTPSTFPQPVFPSASGQQSSGGLQPQPQQQQQQYAGGYATQGYFNQNQYAQQQYGGQQQQQQSSDYSQGAGYQPRSNTPGTNDPNTGLAHQFSHQNLGGAARGQGYARAPSQGQRPRTAGSSGQQPGYNNYMNAPPMPTQGSAPVDEFQRAPERNPDRYGTNANSNQKKCSQLAADFFKDSVKRARERNQRYVTISETYLLGTKQLTHDYPTDKANWSKSFRTLLRAPLDASSSGQPLAERKANTYASFAPRTSPRTTTPSRLLERALLERSSLCRRREMARSMP